MAHHDEDHSYHPKDAISAAMKATALTGSVGLFAAAVQNTLTKQNVGTLGVFVRGGGIITTFAAMGGTYEFIKSASANLREKDDHYNVALGGFFSGAILGLRVRTLPAVLGYGIALSTAMTAFEYTGGSLFGYQKDTSVDEFDRRTALRKAFQTPGEQTLSELGEGRGIYGPGYEERRRERIKATYGIEVPTSPVPAS
ncbi:Mitochondrial inner membrane translocase subunit Tim17/Tim22/Tim23/peroxisomal protein PMP24 [Penicillium fimorum]|uniref:Mitochondrial inner membrane translocase subunit Tim17/Tim22/Tim23/peroxisomal protein PMP24 n=1 Tax=Penicillium fimorum TaxID=1882269 RepID=A0A9X0C6P3_9EURO|nr:Mitochondrial inner membrane translocase subunit Tim17/Tim22/Tim23/peroxisomal protein PMP24 [Penicillium robsamsonii]KAJ5504112.1 Mitochondrial inner membrane translocase subunit Tim17/Tim22/Tim23/peroxisomal protein PMP24 [Penicillium fimorum]KAJ5823429.1 Mitochondrial inner membrane translocase subunit Tim17/Tim22/Tim23/peroxisomal protein PMP24 [Penicillium robsamsonii]